ncbi:nucleoside triphosphate pyrophosphohydrolase [Bacillus marinisedimentorum]|uniref:nucleoside triphosphate pyrophosphohydrolase n=1 Tax=Bacillus marinisedimentorum TaxID=1821260 RepID=UPI0007E1B0FE|nr:nucleoside triphosphate pyrophosphohydrolase [Bacillus marinisedimentorum]
MPIYNKLVRNRIPNILENKGLEYSTKVLSDSDYITALRRKLTEEVEEYFETSNDQDAVEELADVLELIHALAKTHGSSIEQVEEVRKQKAEKRGGFNDKIFLIQVEDE